MCYTNRHSDHVGRIQPKAYGFSEGHLFSEPPKPFRQLHSSVIPGQEDFNRFCCDELEPTFRDLDRDRSCSEHVGVSFEPLAEGHGR